MSNIHPKSEDPALDTLDELVESFKKLLNDASGDKETLEKFQEVLKVEVEKTSSSIGSETIELFTTVDDTSADIAHTSSSDDQELEKLVTLVPSHFAPEEIQKLDISTELNSLYQNECSNKKYMWLTNADTSYAFGGRKYQPVNMIDYKGISAIMEKINSELNLQLDACLVIRYVHGNEALSLHQDNESVLDDAHPIVITSLGSARTLEFWDSRSESTGKLVKKVTPVQGDLLLMNKGCQDNLWHKVLVDRSSDSSGSRFALSFRKLKSMPNTEDKAEKILTSTPHFASLKLLQNGFKVHPDRAPPTPLEVHQRPVGDAHATPRRLPTVSVHHRQPPTRQLHPSTQQSVLDQHPLPSQHPPTDEAILPSRLPTSSHYTLSKHLVIGDSMVKGLRVPGSISICKGGIKPDELLQLLPGSTDILPAEHYDKIRSVTVVVGTNALNVTKPGQGMPLLKVVADYERLIHDLKAMFPNARVGLYNVLPRSHSCEETVNRIKDFNNIFQCHVAPRIDNVFWINQFHEFIDNWGFIREDLFGRLGIHLKGKGKGIMARCIKSFQNSYL